MALPIDLQLMFDAEDEILDIFDNGDDLDRGDLQGAIEAQLTTLIRKVKQAHGIDS